MDLPSRIPLRPDLPGRSHEPELMDDPSGDPVRLAATLRQFALINRLFSRDRDLCRRFILGDMAARGAERVTLLDLGCGGGDFACWFAREMRRRGIAATVLALDIDERAVSFATHACAAQPSVRVGRGTLTDVAAIWPDVRIDYIFANNVLHHLPDHEVPRLLAMCAAVAGHGFLMSDLRRSPGAYFWYRVFAAIFLHNSFAASDGALSIRKAFTEPELMDVIGLSGIADDVLLERVFPGRLFMTNIALE